MKALDRYLNSVKFWLPKAQRDDIVRELSGDLQAQLDEKQSELDRPLNDAEVEDVLKRWGQPLAVAGRYLPQRHLIGPVLYPAYIFVLKLVTLVYLLPWLLIWVGITLFRPIDNPDVPEGDPVGVLWSLWHIILWLFFVITVTFAWLERYKLQAWLAQDWSLEEPSAAGDPRQIPLFDSIVELVVSFALAIWWLDLRRSLGVWTLINTRDGVTLAPIWEYLYWPIFLLLLSGVIFGAVSLIWRRRTMLHVGLSLARAVLCLALIGFLLAAGQWITINTPDQPADKVAQLDKWLNISFLVTFAVIGIACLVKIYRDIRWLRHRGPEHP